MKWNSQHQHTDALVDTPSLSDTPERMGSMASSGQHVQQLKHINMLSSTATPTLLDSSLRMLQGLPALHRPRL